MKWWPLVLVAGCGLSENAFREEQARLVCERNNACASTDQDCDAVAVPPASTIIECTFDEAQAQACLDGIPVAECSGTSFTTPAACSQVFVDCVNTGG
ncbi:MAG: hypothetical protein H6737_07685 [Alphaproteobacteria bacterium]|nr:hypothetical protein [Alphaproteobacteria bacterium]